MEKTLVLVKPDGIERGLLGKILSIYEQRGLNIAAIKMIKPGRALAEKHYEEHKDKSFYYELIDYLTSGNLCAMILEGNSVVEAVRRINGKTDPLEAEAGSIRGMYAYSKQKNVVHSSDSADSASREIRIWFPEFNESNAQGSQLKNENGCGIEGENRH